MYSILAEKILEWILQSSEWLQHLFGISTDFSIVNHQKAVGLFCWKRLDALLLKEISGSFVERDLQVKAFCASSPPCSALAHSCACALALSFSCVRSPNFSLVHVRSSSLSHACASARNKLSQAFHKRATNDKALLRKMTYKDKISINNASPHV